MSEFVASNGIPVTLTNDGVLIVENSDHTYPATIAAGRHVEALREFFQHERDEELGRWRSPSHPDFVAYFNKVLGYLTVTWEPQGGSTQFQRGNVPDAPAGGLPADVARAYFEAHPEPKPWGDALPGQLWKVDTRNQEGLFTWCIWTVGGSRFVTSNGTEYDTDDIISARKIWPEPS